MYARPFNNGRFQQWYIIDGERGHVCLKNAVTGRYLYAADHKLINPEVTTFFSSICNMYVYWKINDSELVHYLTNKVIETNFNNEIFLANSTKSKNQRWIATRVKE